MAESSHQQLSPARQSPQAEAVNDLELRGFLKGCCLFALPLLVVCGPPLLLLALSGEAFRNVAPVLESQIRSGRGLIGFAWNEQNYPYMKYAGLNLQPRRELLALGSSRVLQFRQEMFRQSFWNAGYTIQAADDFREFLRLVPEDRRPRLLLVALDQWMFNSDWIAAAGPGSSGSWTQNPSVNVQQGLRLLPDVISDTLRGRISPAALLAERSDLPFGLNAWQNGKGFRADGSFDYGRQLKQRLNGDPRCPDFEFAASLRRVQQGRERFRYGDAPDKAALQEIAAFLQECSQQKIHVVAFLPPFADVVAEGMRTSGRHDYFRQLPEALRSVFAQTGHELHDFSSMSACGSTDAEAIDGFHAGETATLRMLIRMLEADSRLRECCDGDELQAALEGAVSALQVYATP
ncbi:MAG: hypothetical protein RLZZ436_4075 [Planctomycetota bacterium]|jgi:hypothetical protein